MSDAEEIEVIAETMNRLEYRIQHLESENSRLRGQIHQVHRQKALHPELFDISMEMRAEKELVGVVGQSALRDMHLDPVAMLSVVRVFRSMLDRWMGESAVQYLRTEALPDITRNASHLIADKLQDLAFNTVSQKALEVSEALAKTVPEYLERRADEEFDGRISDRLSAEINQFRDEITQFLDRIPLPQHGTNGRDGKDGTPGKGFEFRGEFDKTTTYAENDVFEWDGSLFIVTKAGKIVNPDRSKKVKLMLRGGRVVMQSVGGGGGSSQQQQNLETTSITPVYYDGTGYVPAIANDIAKTADGVLLSDGSFVSHDRVRWPGHGLTIGRYYYLDFANAGGILLGNTTISGTNVSQRVLYVVSADEVDIRVTGNDEKVAGTFDSTFDNTFD